MLSLVAAVGGLADAGIGVDGGFALQEMQRWRSLLGRVT